LRVTLSVIRVYYNITWVPIGNELMSILFIFCCIYRRPAETAAVQCIICILMTNIFQWFVTDLNSRYCSLAHKKVVVTMLFSRINNRYRRRICWFFSMFKITQGTKSFFFGGGESISVFQMRNISFKLLCRPTAEYLLSVFTV
jgi:hypothetical protein